MYKELRKKSFKHSLFFSFFLFFLGSCMAYGWLAYVKGAVNGFTPFESLAPDEIKDQVVEMNLTDNYGCFMEERTLYIFRFIPFRSRPKYFYYIIQTGDQYDFDMRYMAIKVPRKYRDRMDEIAENSSLGIASEPIYFTGEIKHLDNKEYSYLKDAFIAAGWTEEGFSQITLSCYIDASHSLLRRLLYFLTGIILLVYAIYRIIRGATGGYLKKFYKDLKEAGYQTSSIESDLRSAAPCDDRGSIKIGQLCTYYDLDATVPRAIPNNKIIWAYQDTSSSRFKVVIFLENKQYPVECIVAEETDVKDILSTMQDMFPWIVVGYSDELKELFDKDRTGFLQLRYHTAGYSTVEPGFENSVTAADLEAMTKRYR